ncbi:transcriptional regulator, partial [Escherichia coli]|nr:transcriptional regulator [Escherichia coli]
NRSGEARIGHLDEVTHIISDERQVTTSLVTA